jgi:hypothetical protein
MLLLFSPTMAEILGEQTLEPSLLDLDNTSCTDYSEVGVFHTQNNYAAEKKWGYPNAN